MNNMTPSLPELRVDADTSADSVAPEQEPSLPPGPWWVRVVYFVRREVTMIGLLALFLLGTCVLFAPDVITSYYYLWPGPVISVPATVLTITKTESGITHSIKYKVSLTYKVNDKDYTYEDKLSAFTNEPISDAYAHKFLQDNIHTVQVYAQHPERAALKIEPVPPDLGIIAFWIVISTDLMASSGAYIYRFWVVIMLPVAGGFRRSEDASTGTLWICLAGNPGWPKFAANILRRQGYYFSWSGIMFMMILMWFGTHFLLFFSGVIVYLLIAAYLRYATPQPMWEMLVDYKAQTITLTAPPLAQVHDSNVEVKEAAAASPRVVSLAQCVGIEVNASCGTDLYLGMANGERMLMARYEREIGNAVRWESVQLLRGWLEKKLGLGDCLGE